MSLALAVLVVMDVPLPGWAAQADATSATAAQTPGTGANGRGANNSRGAGTNMGPWEWWNDGEVQKELPLSTDQVKRIHDIYTRRSEDLKPIVDEFLKQSAELEKMTRARVAEESTYAVQVMRVESARSKLGESRTIMLYRLARQLSPEQYRKLQDIRDRRFNNRGRGSDGK